MFAGSCATYLIMKRNKFDELIRDYQEGRLSGKLLETMDAWFDSLPGSAHEWWSEADIERLHDEIDRRRRLDARTIRMRRLLRYAAVLISALAIAFFFWQQEQETNEQPLAASEILPGGNKATLTLADGTVVDLSADQTGIVIGSDNITYADGSDIVGEGGEQLADIKELVLTTPKGGTYQVTLPDGSRVWLNAVSTLKYPNRFHGDKRVVKLEGEGYFDVAEDRRRPFSVLSKGQEVAVLGTQFNISAYPDETASKTTLVTGSVQIVNLATNVAHRLNPGEQSTVHGLSTSVDKVDTDLFTAWKDGFFYFDRLPTPAAIAQLARWYDLDVVYQGKLANVNMFAYIARDKPLDAVLKSLAKSGLQFKLDRSDNRPQLIVLGEQ